MTKQRNYPTRVEPYFKWWATLKTTKDDISSLSHEETKKANLVVLTENRKGYLINQSLPTTPVASGLAPRINPQRFIPATTIPLKRSSKLPVTKLKSYWFSDDQSILLLNSLILRPGTKQLENDHYELSRPGISLFGETDDYRHLTTKHHSNIVRVYRVTNMCCLAIGINEDESASYFLIREPAKNTAVNEFRTWPCFPNQKSVSY